MTFISLLHKASGQRALLELKHDDDLEPCIEIEDMRVMWREGRLPNWGNLFAEFEPEWPVGAMNRGYRLVKFVETDSWL